MLKSNNLIADVKPFKPTIIDIDAMITPLGTESGIRTIARENEKVEIARIHAPKLAGAPPADKFGK